MIQDSAVGDCPAVSGGILQRHSPGRKKTSPNFFETDQTIRGTTQIVQYCTTLRVLTNPLPLRGSYGETLLGKTFDIPDSEGIAYITAVPAFHHRRLSEKALPPLPPHHRFAMNLPGLYTL